MKMIRKEKSRRREASCHCFPATSGEADLVRAGGRASGHSIEPDLELVCICTAE